METHQRAVSGDMPCGTTPEMPPPYSPRVRDLWRKFLPLSISDITMAGSEPLVATTLAHLPDSRTELAALGVAKAIAIFLESPIIMVLHASNALAASPAARIALRQLVTILCVGLTLLLFLLLIPPVFGALCGLGMGVSRGVEFSAWPALALLALWPAMIGWRRYVQGLLIASGAGGVVGRAGLGRIAVVAGALAAGYQLSNLGGATLGALALVAGVTAEALFVTWGGLRRGVFVLPPAPAHDHLPQDLAGVWHYYRPLAGTMLVVWGGRAVMIAVIARAGDASLALAAWPAAWSLVTVVANATRMVQQLAIRYDALVPFHRLIVFAASVGGVCSLGILFLALTPWGLWLLGAFLGQDAELLSAARPTVLLCAFIPLLVALQNALQGTLIARGATSRVQAGAWLGVFFGLLMALGGVVWGFPGAATAAGAMAMGYALEVTYLFLAQPSKGT